MNNVYNAFFNASTYALIFALSLFVHSKTEAQCTLVCNNLEQISLDQDCSVELLPDMILEDPQACPNGDLQVQARINGIWTPANGNGNFVVTSAYLDQTLTVRVRDNNSGNFCEGSILVEDKLDPVVNCANITIPCAVTDYTPGYLLNTLGLPDAFPDVVENCSNVTQTNFDEFFDLGCNESINGIPGLSAYIRRQWTVVDESNNQSSCVQFIYLDRVGASEVSLPADVEVDCSNPDTDPASTGAPFVEFNGATFDLFSNNSACELNITFDDQPIPVCDGTTKIRRTWTIYDWCEPTVQGVNPIEYVQIVEVKDDQGPVVDCPDDLTVNTNPFECFKDLDLPDVIIEDNCSQIASISAVYEVNGIPQSLTGTITSFPFNNPWHPDTLGVLGTAEGLQIGPTNMRYIITDDCGNTSSCNFVITVEDQTPPAAVCDEFTQVSLASNNMALVNASTFDDGSYDNCAPEVFFKARRMDTNSCQSNEFFFDQVKFCCEDLGDSITIVFRVYDIPVPAGQVDLAFGDWNSNDCMVTVFVDDKIKPTCIPPQDVTVSCENFDPSLWAYGQADGSDNCCLDTITETANYNLFDTLCNKGTIIRTFRSFDCGGLSSQCTQRVTVTYEQDYYVRFPNDVIITFCDSSGVYGEPEFFGEDCELLGVSFDDEVFTVVPDACFKIERTWRIINWCTYDPNQPCINVPNPEPNATVNSPANLIGPTVSPLGTPSPWAPTVTKVKASDQVPTNYAQFWNANANCYTYKQVIKIIDGQDPIIDDCPDSTVVVSDLSPNDPFLFNANDYWDPVTESHDLCEGQSDLSISATDLCSGSDLNFSYLLFLDLNQDGDMETVISSNNLPGFNNINVGNAQNPNFTGGTPTAFDFRPVPTNQKYGFALQTTVSGNNKTARVAWNTALAPNNYLTPQLPYGVHKIKWVVNDNCGNEATCEYLIEVKDGKAPTVVCINGLSVNLMPTGMITMWASDFLQYGEDNCTPNDKLIYGIRIQGTGQGFPRDAQGNPITNVTFDCTQLGTQFVELWSEDLAGNADFCETDIVIQDNAGACQPGNKASVAGATMTDYNDPNSGVEDVMVEIEGQVAGPAPAFTLPAYTNNSGAFNFDLLPVSGSYTITPEYNQNHLNGVSTFDLVLISKHILGLEPLSSPYKMLAADANFSGSITTFDIVELRKLILGIYSELPNNSSWRFVVKNHSFQNPSNPFMSSIPGSITIPALDTAGFEGADFIAIKIGDVNGSAISNSLQTADDRSYGTLYMDVEDRELRLGDVFTIEVDPSDRELAYQFTMLFEGLELLDLAPGANSSADNFGRFEDALTCSVDGQSGAFALTFRALQNGRLSELLSLSSSITPAEAYNREGLPMQVAFRFDGNQVETHAFELMQNVPNPASGSAQISFYLPEASDATLTFTNIEGKLVKRIDGQFVQGMNTLNIQTGDFEPGVLIYRIETATHSASRKMVVLK